MKIAIKDANIIFDLIETDLFEKAMLLDYQFITSDFVVNEIKREYQKEAIRPFFGKRLLVLSIASEKIPDLHSIQNANVKLSLPDCSVLFLAKEHGAMVLTGDNLIRKVSKKMSIECHGILWIIDQLVENKIINIDDAIKKLSGLLKNNNRLPKAEADKLLIKWSAKGKL